MNHSKAIDALRFVASHLLVFVLLFGGQIAHAESSTPFKSVKISPLVAMQRGVKLRVHGRADLRTRLGQIHLAHAGISAPQPDSATVAVYYAQEPDLRERQRIAEMLLHDGPGVWIPPVPGHHRHGYLLITAPYASLDAIAQSRDVLSIHPAERASHPLNDQGALAIRADLVHAGLPVPYHGNGVIIAILDSSLDIAHPDIPAPVEAYDVTDGNGLANWGTDVSSTVSDHGTHVVASALGRGTASLGKYRGIAPGAELTFYKIGNDIDATATEADEVEALTRAVTAGADVVSISYGGWGVFMDGSEPMDQAIDAAVANGVPVFVSAGNARNDAQHDQATIPGGQSVSTGLDLVVDNTQGVTVFNTDIYINVIRQDSNPSDDNLDLRITNLAADESFLRESYATSVRGTESTMFRLTSNVAAGQTKTYALALDNSAAAPSVAHLYAYAPPEVYFVSADATHTVTNPATADGALAVAAWVSREYWYNWLGNFWTYGYSPDILAPFSSLGPRIDGVLKPDLTAPGSAVVSCRDFGVPAPPDSVLVSSDGSLDGSGPTDYTVKQGTSMACPMAAGAAALMLEAYPGLTAPDIAYLLRATASQRNASDEAGGYGLINVAWAITVDCNQNAQIDVLDIRSGYSNDANSNGVPDECEDDQIDGFVSQLVVSEFDEAPAPLGEYRDLNAFPSVNNHRQVAFWAEAQFGTGVFLWDQGIVTPLVLEGDTVPGVPSSDVGRILKDISINDSGTVVVNAEVRSTGATGILQLDPGGVVALATAGDPLDDVGGTMSGFYQSPIIHNTGDVFFHTHVTGLAGGIGSSGAIVRHRDGVTSLLVASGQVVPGIGSISRIDQGPWKTAEGEFLFRGEYDTGIEALWQYQSGTFRTVATTSDRAPGTVQRFTGFTGIADAAGPGATYFQGRYQDSPTQQGIFRRTYSGATSDVVLPGDAAPLAGHFFEAPGLIQAGTHGELYFHSPITTDDPPAGIFRFDPSRARYEPVILHGDPAPALPGHFIDDLGRYSINAAGDWALLLKTTDDRRHIVMLDQCLPGDLDGDDDVDHLDYARFLQCLSGPDNIRPPACAYADLDSDGRVDLSDFSRMQIMYIPCGDSPEDCNNNGRPDDCDMDNGIATDCDRNGVLDECEILQNGLPDCNGNLLPDHCDIQSGASADTNSNGQPDECEDLPFFDCNFNNVEDTLEIAAGSSNDCDSSGVPDECDLFRGDRHLLAFVRQPSNNIVSLDPETAAIEQVLSGENAYLRGLAETCGGDVWGLGATGQIARVDTVTGQVTVVATAPDIEWDGAAFDCRREVLYGSTLNGVTYADELYEINPENGGLRMIGRLLIDFPALAYDPQLDQLYGMSDSGLYAIDRQNAWETHLCPGPSEVQGLSWADGELYILTYDAAIYRLNPNTCALVPVGSFAGSMGAGTGLAVVHDSSDCNSNSVPDSCEIALGILDDCNSNGQPDTCELAQGDLEDCDSNNIPDVCQQWGPEYDCNSDGFLDLCQRDDPAIYWTYLFGGTYRANLDGSNARRLESIPVDQPTGIAIDSRNREVYWADRRLDVIQRANLDGSNAVVVLSQFNATINDLAIDPGRGYIFWTEINADVIKRANLDGTGINTLASNLNNPRALAIDTFAGVVYWTDDTNWGHIWRSNMEGTDTVALTSVTSGNIQGLAIDTGTGYMFWTESNTGRIGRARLDGTGAMTLIDGLSEPRGLALDIPTQRLFWVDSSLDILQSADFDGNNLRTLATSIGDAPHYLAIGRTTFGDCTANAILDTCDILHGEVSDLNSDGLPDSCNQTFVDCNSNGKHDGLDIESGVSVDCDANRVPDECDLAAGSAADMNSNGILDDCEDCNSNGVPDPADIAHGTSVDCDANSVPDTCQMVGQFVRSSPPLTPFGAGFPQSYALLDPPLAIGDVHLRFDVVAKVTTSSRYVRIELNGAPITTVFANGGNDCSAVSIAEITVDSATYNAAAASGVVTIDLLPNGSVGSDCTCCAIRSEATVIVSYIGATVYDCDGSHVLDICEIACNQSEDCNHNAIPDHCEGVVADCNSNGVGDLCEIAAGTSFDCNANQIPDGCLGIERDCNSNWIPDECDLDAGSSTDIDINGVPDECETGPGVLFWNSYNGADYDIFAAELDALTTPRILSSRISLRGIDVDAVNQALFFLDLGRDELAMADLTFATATHVTGSGPDAFGMAYDWHSERLFWTRSSTTDGRIYSATRDGIYVDVLRTGLQDPRKTDYDGLNNYVYWIESTGQRIGRVRPNGSEFEYLLSNVGQGFDLAVDPYAEKFYWSTSSPMTIERADFDGGNREVLISGVSVWTSIAIDLVHGHLYFTDASNHAIKRMNLDGSGVVTLSIPNLMFPGVIHVEPLAELP